MQLNGFCSLVVSSDDEETETGTVVLPYAVQQQIKDLKKDILFSKSLHQEKCPTATK